MDDLKKMVLAVANSVSSFKSEIIAKIDESDKKTKEGFKKTNARISNLENKLTKRIDNLGLNLAELSDDAPTMEDFEKLEKRVSKVEHRTVSV